MRHGHRHQGDDARRAAGSALQRDRRLDPHATRPRARLAPGAAAHDRAGQLGLHVADRGRPPFGVSAEAFLRRLVTLGRVSAAFYRARREEFLAAYEEEERRDRPAGGSFYRNKARDLGKGYVRLVADARRRRVIDSYTAASFLDVKVTQIERLAEAAALRSAV